MVPGSKENKAVDEVSLKVKDMSLAPGWGWIGSQQPTVKQVDLNRHCAFCVNPIPAEKVMVCSKCHRRAYCSRKCQAKDWKARSDVDGGTGKKGTGQGHKSWCGIPYGEEDLDWVVTSGGILAKRFIPANSRIMVEGFVDDLNKANPREAVTPRTRNALAKHDCDGNSSRCPDPEFKSMVLYAKRDIQPGEGIKVNLLCINEFYSALANPVDPRRVLMTFADCRKVLRSQWKIICPRDCFCRKDGIDKAIMKGRNLFSRIEMFAANKNYSAEDADGDMKIIFQLLDNYHHIHGCLMQKTSILKTGFEIAVQQEKTLDQAKDWVKEGYEIWSTIMHPRCKETLKCEKLMKDITTSNLYLALEKGPLGKDVK